MSQTTKRALAASLKKLVEDRSLDSVTVVDIAADCGVNRQTFYYHFRDILELVDWTYTDEAARALAGRKTSDSWEEGFLSVFRCALKNRTFVYRTYHSRGREHLERYLRDVTRGLLMGVIEEKARGLPAREEDKSFIADFYKHAFVGLMLDWIGRGMLEEPEAIVQRLSTMIEGDFDIALRRFCSGGRPEGRPGT